MERGGTRLVENPEKEKPKQTGWRGGALAYKLLFVGFLTLIYTLIEIVVALRLNSLALFSDGFHNLSDVAAVGVAVWADQLAGMESDDVLTFGWRRADLLGGLWNGFFLLSLSVFTLLQAIPRFFMPDADTISPDVKFLGIPADWIFIGVSGLGMIINFVASVIFCGHGHGHSHGGGGGHGHAHGGGGGGGGGEHGHAHGGSGGGHGHAHGHDTPKRTLSFTKSPSMSEALESYRAQSPRSSKDSGVAAGHSHGHGHGHGHGHSHGHESTDAVSPGSNGEYVEMTSPEQRAHRHPAAGDVEVGQLLVGELLTAKPAAVAHPEEEHNHRCKFTFSSNLWGVMVHYMSDTLSSMFVMCVGLLVHFYPRESWTPYCDPAASVCINILILVSAVPLVKSCMWTLLQVAPDHIAIPKVRSDIEKVNGVVGLHDFHVWQLVDSLVVTSLHIELLEDSDFNAIADDVRTVLHSYGLHCSTIQPEFVSKSMLSPADTCQTNCVTDCRDDWCCKPRDRAGSALAPRPPTD